MKTIKVQLKDITNKDIFETGKEPRNHSPFTDFCRKLIREGEDPRTRLEAYRGETLCLTTIIGEGAQWDILENDKKGPLYRKYRPSPYGKTGQDSDSVSTTDAIK